MTKREQILIDALEKIIAVNDSHPKQVDRLLNIIDRMKTIARDKLASYNNQKEENEAVEKKLSMRQAEFYDWYITISGQNYMPVELIWNWIVENT